ncbi:MAG: integral rane protein [Gemmatimonadetes bacterium]|nr:integral rane protein [Gemmatimonadota bacterium]
MRVAAVLVVVGVILFAAWKAGLFALDDRAELAAAIERARAVPYVAPLFVLTYAIAAAVGVPATPFTLAGGALFGIPLGIGLNWLGEMMAALLAFGITRATGVRAGARVAETDAEGDTAVASLSKSRAFATLIRLRLVPVAPFALLNAGAAIGGMSWRDFAIATGLGIIPITVIYTVSASKLVAGVEGSGTQALATASASAAVLIAASFLPSIIRLARRRSA